MLRTRNGYPAKIQKVLSNNRLLILVDFSTGIKLSTIHPDRQAQLTCSDDYLIPPLDNPSELKDEIERKKRERSEIIAIFHDTDAYCLPCAKREGFLDDSSSRPLLNTLKLTEYPLDCSSCGKRIASSFSRGFNI